MNYMKTIARALASLTLTTVVTSFPLYAEEAHDYGTSKLFARQEIGTNNDCTPNGTGEVGHLSLQDETIRSTIRKSRKERLNLSLDLSISLSSMGFSSSQIDVLTSQVKKIQNETMGIPPALSQFADVAVKIKTLKPKLHIIRNGAMYSSCEAAQSLVGWKLSPGRYYCSSSPLVANVFSNTLDIRFRNSLKEGVLACTDAHLHKFKPRIKENDLIKIVFSDGSTKLQATVRKLRNGKN